MQLNVALTSCSLSYGVDEMVVMHTLSLSLFIPKGKAHLSLVCGLSWVGKVRAFLSVPL